MAGKTPLKHVFWLTIMDSYNLCTHSPYKYSPKLDHVSHYHLTLPPPSHPSATMCFHCWPFRKIDYFGNSEIVWNSQLGWQRTAMKCGLSGCHVGLFGGCKVDHQGLFRLRQETYLTPVPFCPTIYFSKLYPHWFSFTPSPPSSSEIDLVLPHSSFPRQETYLIVNLSIW